MTRHDDIDPELLSVYQAEVLELLDTLGALLDQMQHTHGAGQTELLRAASRIAHTIKGSSRITGFTTIVELAHAMEDELHGFDPEGSPEEQLKPISRLFEAISIIGEVVAKKRDPQAASALAQQMKSAQSQAPGANTEENHRNPPSQKSPDPQNDSPAPDEDLQTPVNQAQSQAEHSAPAAKLARIDLARLDKLMDAVKELIISHQFVNTIDREIAAHVENTSSKELRQLFWRRQNTVEPMLAMAERVLSAGQKLRMVPLHFLVSQWRRTAAEAAHALNKSIELQADIGELELDRHVLDRIKDPMLHLIRNSIDHGIESQSERDKRNKARTGIVQIRARLSGTTAIIEVSDDGRGIDSERIRIQAVRQGLLEPEQAASLSLEELSACLFHPGFSTASSVSTLSGRGVGLDVVRETVRTLGGHVEVRHPPLLGGTTFRMEVPVDVALVRGLLVASGNNKFVLPVEHIEQVFQAKADQLHCISDEFYVNIEAGGLLRIEPLWPSLSIPSAGSRVLTIVWMRHGRRAIGLWVDELFEERLFATHPPPWNLKRVTGIGAFTVLDDRKPAVVIDISSLFDRKSWQRSAEPARSQETPRILVVDDSLSIRTMVRTTLQSAGYEVVVKPDGQEAWKVLNEMPFSLVVSDVRMPGMDGFELVRKIRSSDNLKNLPVILLTSMDRPEDISAGAKSGADEYIVKGRFDQSKLLEAVARFV